MTETANGKQRDYWQMTASINGCKAETVNEETHIVETETGPGFSKETHAIQMK